MIAHIFKEKHKWRGHKFSEFASFLTFLFIASLIKAQLLTLAYNIYSARGLKPVKYRDVQDLCHFIRLKEK